MYVKCEDSCGCSRRKYKKCGSNCCNSRDYDCHNYSAYNPCSQINQYNSCNQCNQCNQCNPFNFTVQANINTLTLTTTASTPLTYSAVINCPTGISNPVTIGTSAITFRDIGVYNISGNINLTNTSTGATNITLIPTVLTGGAIISPTTTSYTGIGAGTIFNGVFNYTVQITVPNTQLIMSISSSGTPVIVTGGQINITRSA